MELRRTKSQIARLKEAVSRLETYTARQIDHKAVLDELAFLREALDGTIRFVQKSQRETRVKEIETSERTPYDIQP